MDEGLRRVRRVAWRVWQEDVAVRAQGAWADLGGLVCHATGLDHQPWNGAFLTSQAGLARLGEARAWFAARQVPWGLLVPAEMGLQPVGMRDVAQLRLMTRRLDALPLLPHADLRWGDPETAAAVQDAGFGDEPGRNLDLLQPKVLSSSCALVTVHAGGLPVSTATLFVVDGVAAVFGVATVPAFQRQGYGGIATLAALHRAAAHGCDLAMLNPTDAGYALYAGLGFVDEPPWRVWADPGGSAVSPPGP